MSFTLYNVPIDHVSDDQLHALLSLWMKDHAQKVIVTPNPEILLHARRDPSFLSSLQRSHLALPDGVGLRFAAAALTDRKLRFRHTGVDTLYKLAAICENTGKRLVLFGGFGDVPERSARALRKMYPELDVIGLNPGTVLDEGGHVDEDVVAELRTLRPHVLAVAIGAGKSVFGRQEAIMHHLLPLIPSIKVAIGVGGALDMIAGDIRRAPRFMRRIGLEWLWRMAKQPTRSRRIIAATVVFASVVAYDSLRGGRFFRALPRVAREVALQMVGR